MKLIERFIFTALLPFALQCKSQEMAFKLYNQKDGLTSNNIRHILQDRRGILWICTSDGISWYDGSRFKEISLPVRAHQLLVNNIMADSHSNILVSTYYNGLYLFNNNRFKNYLVNSKNLSAGANSIFQILELSSNRYLVATDDNAWIFDGSLFRPFDAHNPLLKRQISALAQTNSGDILLVVDKGLFYYRKTNSGWVNEGLYLNTYSISKIICFGRDCWMATDKGILYFDSIAPDNVTPVCKAYNEPISDIISDLNTGILLVRADAVERMEKGKIVERIISKENGVGSFPFTTAFFDREKNMWLGSLKGLLKLNDLTTKFFPVKKKGSPDPSIISLCPVKQVLWMGTFNGLIRKEKNKLTYINKAGGRAIGYVLFIKSNDDGSIRAGTSAGLLQIGVNNSIRVLDTSAYSAYFADNRGVIWMAGNNKYAYYKNGRTQILQSNLNPQYRLATAIYVDSLGYCWVGYQTDGVKLFRLKQDSLILVKEYLNHQDENSRVRGLATDTHGHLLVGSRTEGLFVLSQTNMPGSAVEHIDHKLGLKGKWIKGMLPFARDSFLIITNNGAFILTYNKLHFQLQEINFYFQNLSNEFYGAARWNEHFLITTDGGYFDYQPANAFYGSQPPFTYISSVQVNNKSDTLFHPYTQQETERIFPYFENDVSIEFTSTSFKNEESTNFKYKLNGIDKNWSDVTTLHRVNYNSLPPGRYKFEVLARNNVGQWGTSPAVYSFRITPPVWKRWWFILLSVLVISVLLYSLYRYRLQSLLAVERLRMKISTDLHDDVGSTLSSITILSQIALMDSSSVGCSEEIVQEIKNNSALLMEKMDDIVWSIRPNNDTLDSFLLRVKRFAAQLFEAKEIDYHFSVPEEVKGIQIPMEYRLHIFLMVKEAINNLVKYANCSKASLTLIVRQKELHITVEDNGKGFDPNLVYNGNGLNNMRHRAELMRATLVFDSAPGKGTRVHLFVKIK